MAETTVGGLRAVELYFRPIRNISTGGITFFQSLTRLNTPGLGTLQPESFREVSEVTTQCTDLFRLELLQGIEVVKKFEEREVHFEWLTVYMPVRFLLEIRADRTLLEYCDKYEIPTGKLCLALRPAPHGAGQHRSGAPAGIARQRLPLYADRFRGGQLPAHAIGRVPCGLCHAQSRGHPVYREE